MAKDVILVMGDGDSGRGSAVIIDYETGAMLRDRPAPNVQTDNFESYAEHEKYFYIRDSDSSLICYDKDNVVRARRDVGYYDGAGRKIWVTDAGVHLIKDNKEFNTFTPGEEQLTKLMTYAHGTLDIVSEVVLSAPELGDIGTNTNYLGGRDNVKILDSLGFWVTSGNSALFPSGEGFVKVDYTGTVIDSYDNTNGIQFGYVVQSIEGNWCEVSNSDPSNFTYRTVDLAANTVGASVGPINFHAEFSLTYAGYINYPNLNQVAFSLSAGVLKFAFGFYDGNDPAFTPARDGTVNGAVLCSAAGATPTITGVVPLLSHDSDKRPVGYRYLTPSYFAYNPATSDWVCGHDYGLWRVDNTSVLWNYDFPPYGVQQAYSSDGERLEGLLVKNWATYAIAGVLTDTVAVEGRTLHHYDQTSGDRMYSEAVVGGAYTGVYFSPDPKFLVCASADGTKNYQINAHLIPA